MNIEKKLDKFYTKKEISKKCLSILFNILNLNGNELFLEPSAGNGSFSSLLKNCEAYDILPEDEKIVKADFLTLKLENKNYITIGNPPFGKRAKLAIDFFNKCSEVSKVIAFILPNTFCKYGVQSKLNKDFDLIYNKSIDKNSFTFLNKDYNLRCCFQIWVKKEYNKSFKSLRKGKPSVVCDDFKLWQHNATIQSRKYLDEDWKYATFRQGYKDYKKIFTKENYAELHDIVYNTNIQLFFIKPLNSKAEYIFLNKMDLNELASRNLSTPGFGKADFIEYYKDFL